MKPIFLMSLPRSGSTLIQRLLASHQDVATVSEPWILLPYLYTLKSHGVYAEYDQRLLITAIKDFCREMPNGKADYLAEMRSYVLRLYETAAGGPYQYFLDKTPRYHLVADKIFELFPDAKYIFLWRNPLAVVASIAQSFSGAKWSLHRNKVDLFTGLENLVSAYSRKVYFIQMKIIKCLL